MGYQRMRWTCLLALMMPLAALAQMSAKQVELLNQTDAWHIAVASKMKSIDTADSLTSAALLLPVALPAADQKTAVLKDQPTEGAFQAAVHESAGARLQLLDRAAALAPDAADIAAMALRLCTQVAGCDVSAHSKKLHHAAPKDAGYLLPALVKAQEESKVDEVDRTLRAMAGATTLNSYYTDIQKRLQRTTDQSSDWPEPPLSGDDDDSDFDNKLWIVSLGTVSMQVVANNLAGFSAIDKACKASAPQFTDRREACRSIGVALSRDSTMSSVRIGLAFWRRTAKDAADLAVAKQASHVMDWRLESYVGALGSGMIDPRSTLRATLDNGGELPGVLALMKKHALPNLPPEGWVSQREKRELEEAKRSAPSASAPAGERQKVPE